MILDCQSFLKFCGTFVHTCFLCSKAYALQKLLHHSKKKTWKKFFRSICWHQTPQKPDYLFVKADCKHPDIKKKHFGCPSCPAHLNLLNALKDHFINDYPGSMLHAFQQESNVIPPRSSNKRSAEDTVDIEEADFKLMNPSGLSTVPPCYDDRLIIDGFDVMD
ncbi:hypothetical protein F4703DRAFT_1792416 [Phycomyces blakesleeanus]